MNSATNVQKRWTDCNILRDERMRYGDDVEETKHGWKGRIEDQPVAA